MQADEAVLQLFGMIRQPDGELPEVTLQPRSPADWQQLLDAADQQEVAPLLYHRLRDTSSETAVPTDVLGGLRASFHRNAARNLRLYHELGVILERLQVLSAPVIVLKGAFLAWKVYENPALRSIGDIDILLGPEDVPRATESLGELGYKRMVPPWVNIGWHVELSAARCMANLEIHWDLAAASKFHRIPPQEVWESAVPIELAGAQVLALCPEELLLHLSYHAAILHLYRQGIRALVDVDRVLHRYGDSIDWEKVARLAAARGLRKVVALTLYLCWLHLGTRIPPSPMDGLGFAGIDPRVVRQAMAQISRSPRSIGGVPPGLWRTLGEDRLQERVKLFLQFAASPKQSQYQLPRKQSKLSALYYGLQRIVYLLREHGHTMLLVLRDSLASGSGAAQRRAFLRWLGS